MQYRTDYPEPTPEAVDELAEKLHDESCTPGCYLGHHGYRELAREQLRAKAREEVGAITPRAAGLRQRAADTLERAFLENEAPEVQDLVDALVAEGLIP